MIEIQIRGTGTFAAGEQVTGQIIWTPQSDKQPRGIHVTLAWRTEGRGTRDSREVATTSLQVPPIIAEMPVSLPFAIDLPYDGPISYSGMLLSIIWEVRVRVDLPWAIDEKFAAPLIVMPREKSA
jgi:hypothetical protein